MIIILDAHQDGDLSKASDLLRAGKLVAAHTETVYGLASTSANPH